MKEYRTRELYGDFYENENKSKPLLVVIGGSIAGIPTISKDLLEFRANFHVLALAYFGVGGTYPNTSKEFPWNTLFMR